MGTFWANSPVEMLWCLIWQQTVRSLSPSPRMGTRIIPFRFDTPTSSRTQGVWWLAVALSPPRPHRPAQNASSHSYHLVVYCSSSSSHSTVPAGEWVQCSLLNRCSLYGFR